MRQTEGWTKGPVLSQEQLSLLEDPLDKYFSVPCGNSSGLAVSAQHCPEQGLWWWGRVLWIYSSCKVCEPNTCRKHQDDHSSQLKWKLNLFQHSTSWGFQNQTETHVMLSSFYQGQSVAGPESCVTEKKGVWACMNLSQAVFYNLWTYLPSPLWKGHQPVSGMLFCLLATLCYLGEKALLEQTENNPNWTQIHEISHTERNIFQVQGWALSENSVRNNLFSSLLAKLPFLTLSSPRKIL